MAPATMGVFDFPTALALAAAGMLVCDGRPETARTGSVGDRREDRDAGVTDARGASGHIVPHVGQRPP